MRILPVDFFGGELYIDHGGLNLAMSHELHCIRAGKLMPLHSMSRAKVCRNRCGLALDRSVMRR